MPVSLRPLLVLLALVTIASATCPWSDRQWQAGEMYTSKVYNETGCADENEDFVWEFRPVFPYYYSDCFEYSFYYSYYYSFSVQCQGSTALVNFYSDRGCRHTDGTAPWAQASTSWSFWSSQKCESWQYKVVETGAEWTINESMVCPIHPINFPLSCTHHLPCHAYSISYFPTAQCEDAAVEGRLHFKRVADGCFRYSDVLGNFPSPDWNSWSLECEGSTATWHQYNSIDCQGNWTDRGTTSWEFWKSSQCESYNITQRLDGQDIIETVHEKMRCPLDPSDYPSSCRTTTTTTTTTTRTTTITLPTLAGQTSDACVTRHVGVVPISFIVWLIYM